MTDQIDPAPGGVTSDNPPSRKQSGPVGAVESSGNVFADLNVPNPGVALRLADARIAGLPKPIARALAELVSVAIESVGEHEPQLVAALDDAVAAIMGAVLPAEMTPAIAAVLGLPIQRTQPLGWLFRAAGADIPPRIEAEQAYVLFRFLHLAIVHGDDWKRRSDEDVREARAEAERRTTEAAGQDARTAP